MKVNVKEVVSKKENTYKEIELKNKNNMTVKCIDMGCAITEIIVPDKDNNFENVVLGYKDYDTYNKNSGYLGCIVGRSSGRIGSASVEINGEKIELIKNSGDNTLHGGFSGLSFKKFECVNIVEEEDSASVEFMYISEDNEENFPGEVTIKVIYSLNNKNELKISYEASSSKDTILNLTNHSYFNLSGNCKTKVINHNLSIDSTVFAELDDESIVTGKMIPVYDTPFDFNKSKKISRDINDEYNQLLLAKGYDHYFRLDKVKDVNVELYDEVSGRVLEIETDCNGVVVYTTNFTSEGMLTIDREIEERDAVCLEVQNLPIGRQNKFIEDSILLKDEKYKKETVYRFGIK